MLVLLAVSLLTGVLVGLTFRVTALLPVAMIAVGAALLGSWLWGMQHLYIAEVAGLVLFGTNIGYLFGAALIDFVLYMIRRR